MKRLILLCGLLSVFFSCVSKKTVITKKPKTNKEQVDIKVDSEKSDETTAKPKVYINSTEKYIDTYKTIAQDEMRLYHIPASITLAQGILESGSGKAILAVKGNNHFGIKCHGWTGKEIYHKDEKPQECFRKYRDVKYSYRDHSLFLSNRKRYAGLFKLKKEDYIGWAEGLKAAGYATDRKYAQKLISLIEIYELYELDKEVLEGTYKPSEELVVINEPTVYTVVKGDTLYSISRRYNMTVKELKDLNGLNDNIIGIGQKLIVKTP